MSRDLQPWEWQLHGGQILIAEADDRYRPRDARAGHPRATGHSLQNIEAVLADARGPLGTPYENWPAFEVFVGFVLFDAWVGNTDRHENNWAVLHGPAGQLHLAPSFNHGSALASGLTDANRTKITSRGELEAWCSRGVAYRFEDMGGTSLLDFAYLGLDRVAASAREHWLGQIRAVTDEQCHAVVDAVPDLSDPARTFVPLLGFTQIERTYERPFLFPLFAERVMSPRRPDRAEYLATLNLGSDATPLEVLTRSGGRRHGDTIELVPIPTIQGDRRTSSLFMVHGVRYRGAAASHRIARLVRGDTLALAPEPTNEADPLAIGVLDSDGLLLGYVPKPLTEYVHTLESGRRLTVEVANSAEVAEHLRLLVRLRGHLPSGVDPFTGPQWETTSPMTAPPGLARIH